MEKDISVENPRENNESEPFLKDASVQNPSVKIKSKPVAGDFSSENPIEKAGFFSLLTFSWMGRILKYGSKHPLEEKHLFPLETHFQAGGLADALEREWLSEMRSSEQNRKKPRLWRAMFKMFSFREYMVVAILRIFYSFSMNLLPLALWFFLKNISTSAGTTNYSSTLPFMFSITVISLARSLFITHGAFKVEMMGYRLKVAVIGLIYKKILKLKRCTLENEISENVITLASNDAQAIGDLGYHAQGALFVALDIVVALLLLWYLVSWQALIGVVFLVFVSVYNSLAAKKSGKIRKKVAAQTDKRLEMIKEIVSGIRVVKMYAWEWNFRDLVAQIRRSVRRHGHHCHSSPLAEVRIPRRVAARAHFLIINKGGGQFYLSFDTRKEISLIRIRGFFLSSVYALFFTGHAVTGFISVVVLLLTGHFLTSFKVFTLLSVLANIKFFVTVYLGECLHRLADTRTAWNRMQPLLEEKTLLGSDHKSQCKRGEDFKPGQIAVKSERKLEDTSEIAQPQVVLENVSSVWNDSSDRSALQNVSLHATSGQLVGITGPVGSGKTSLLMTILDELPISSGQSSCIGKMAYVSQTPWVYSGTVRENIVFGMPFVEEKYFKIVEVCDLGKDLSSFPKGDLTEIGQRGIILSGGQRARVSLARALYSDADIYLLDDPLSAVDAKVGKHLFDRCIKEFLAGRVRILVTHQLQFLQHAEHVVILQNGSVQYQGSYSQIDQKKLGYDFIVSQGKQEEGENSTITGLGEDKRVRKASSVDEFQERVDLAEEEEDRMVGTVKWQLYWKYFRAALPVPLIVALAVFFAIVQVAWIAPYWWLSLMTEMSYQEQKNYVTLVIYGSIVIVSLLLTLASSFCFYLATLKASENLHERMTKAVIQAPVLFFDTNPVGRILNRFSKDIGNMDDSLPSQFLFAVQLCIYFFSATILSAVVNVWLLITCAPLTLLFMYLAKYYLNSSREIRRLESISCSPVYSLIADTVAGMEVIRSSGMESDFLQQFYKYQDKNTSAMIMRNAATQWLALRGDLLSIFLVTSVSAGALLATQSLALAGMSLTYALDTLEASQYGISVASETENHMTSVERVFTYTEIDPEPGYRTDTQPPKEWPKSGSLTLGDLSLAYLEGAPRILVNINVSIAAKEKVGVVGRTGAGKSSLLAALFRMPEPEGSVIIDGVNIRDLNLQAARKSMAVITQDPVLFSGSLSRNLDPFSLYKDHDLWSALEEVQLDTLVQKLPEQLGYKLRESGSNFSVGERQLVCLARALLQKSKIIILDEATANVDYKTDRLIQEVIRNRLKDSTVITIAHRLNTIMDYDKVLVMDQGRMVEFDKPETLLQNSDGYFSRLVETHNIATAE